MARVELRGLAQAGGRQCVIDAVGKIRLFVIGNVMRPVAGGLDLAQLERSFTIRSNEGFVEVFAAQLVAAVTAVAPNLPLHFAPKPDKDVRALREGLVDLEIGVRGGRWG